MKNYNVALNIEVELKLQETNEDNAEITAQKLVMDKIKELDEVTFINLEESCIVE